MTVELLTLPGIPLVRQGDDLAALIGDAIGRAGIVPRDGDIVVLAQKIVSKAEGRLVDLATVTPRPEAIPLAAKVEKDPRLIELVLSEAATIVAARPGLLLVEHRLGFVMPNAGIDQSNVDPGHALLLPVDPHASAEALRSQLASRFGARIAVVINDSVSRAWRNGTCGIAIGCAGMPVLNDLRGTTDLVGRQLQFSITGYADELAAAASLVMGQSAEGTPVVVVRGLQWKGVEGNVSDLLRRPSVLTPGMVTPVKTRSQAMLEYTYAHSQVVAQFVAQLIPAVRQYGFGPNIKAFGIIQGDKLIAGMVYHNYDPGAGVIEMSGAALPGYYWLTRETLRRMYSYPFRELGCQMVLMRVAADDSRLLRQLAALNYSFITVPRLFGRNKDAVACLLTREAWQENKFNKHIEPPRDILRVATQEAA